MPPRISSWSRRRVKCVSTTVSFSKESARSAKVRDVQVLVSVSAVDVVRSEERALDQQNSRPEELRRGVEDRRAAVARIGEQRDLLAARDLDAAIAQRGDLRARDAGELVLQLVADLREEIADRRAPGGGPGRIAELEVAPQRDPAARNRRLEARCRNGRAPAARRPRARPRDPESPPPARRRARARGPSASAATRGARARPRGRDARGSGRSSSSASVSSGARPNSSSVRNPGSLKYDS